MAYLKVSGSGYIKLAGDYAYNTMAVSDVGAYTTIDSGAASWIVSNSANQYPDATTSYLTGSGTINKYAFIVYNAGYGLTLKSGTVWGEVPQTSDWNYTYNNSAAVRLEYAPAVTVESWRIDKVWDAIRIQTGSDNFLINNVHLSNVRDDAIENDSVLGGTIRNSLFDGVFTGISLGNSSHADGSRNTITLENVFLRHESYLANGEWTHQSPFKTDTTAPETTPNIRIIDSVIAIEDPTHGGLSRLKLAWEHVVESRGNVFLNLSDEPLPSYYPMPPAGFTILHGQEARDYWVKAKAAWLDNHDGTPTGALTALPSLTGSVLTSSSATLVAPVIQEAPAVVVTNTINGTAAADKLIGTAGADQISAFGGNDMLFGKGGKDVLTGGAGADKFVFDTAVGSSVATITDFDPALDKIFLDNAVFTKLGTGSLSSPTKLNSGWLEDWDHAYANDQNDYIIYDRSTGALSYDVDGNRAAAPVVFAQLQAGLDLSANNFFVI